MKNYKLYIMLSMISVDLSLTSAFAMEERSPAPATHSRASQHQGIDYISRLPDELKHNILAYLDPKTLAAMSETSAGWYDLAQDKNLLKPHEKYFQEQANQVGIKSKYNPYDTWRDIFINRQNEEWVFNSFKKGVAYFDALAKHYKCHIGSNTIHPDGIRRMLQASASGKDFVRDLANRLSWMEGANVLMNLSHDIRFASGLVVPILNDMAENKDPRILNFLKYKHVTDASSLAPEEVLAFCALNEIPVLNSQDSDQLVPVDKKNSEVIRAIRSSLFFDGIRQFIKDYSRLTLDADQQALKSLRTALNKSALLNSPSTSYAVQHIMRQIDSGATAHEIYNGLQSLRMITEGEGDSGSTLAMTPYVGGGQIISSFTAALQLQAYGVSEAELRTMRYPEDYILKAYEYNVPILRTNDGKIVAIQPHDPAIQQIKDHMECEEAVRDFINAFLASKGL